VQDSQVPSKFPIPWGSSAGGAYIRPIPTASQIGIQAGAASLTDGFPPLCLTPEAESGVPPFGQDMNGILKQITQWSQWQQAGGPLFYDSVFSAAIGGYPSGAVVASAVLPGLLWVSTADNNASNPETGGANWLPLQAPFPSYADAVAAEIPSGVNALFLSGYYVAGDPGAGTYERTAGSTYQLTTADGSHWRITNPIVTPFQLGARGGSTDDTVAMQAWLDMPTARFLPTNTFLVGGTSGACLTWSNGGIIFGGGGASSIMAKSGTPTNVSVLMMQTVNGATPAGPFPAGNYNSVIRDLVIELQRNGDAQHGLLLSVPAQGNYISGLLVSNLQIGRFQNGITFNNGNGIILDVNEAATNGSACITLEDCTINSGGVVLQNHGDSVRVSKCQIGGYSGGTPVNGITATPIPGAGGPYIDNCNITTAYSSIVLTNTQNASIRDTECESNFTYSQAGASLIELNGATGTHVEGGSITCFGNSAACVYITNNGATAAVGNTFDRVSMAVGASGMEHVSLGAGVQGNYISQSCRFNNQGVIVQQPVLSLTGSNNPNYGIFTQGLALQNSWTGTVGPTGSQKAGLFTTKNDYGLVCLAGCITGGTQTTNTLVATLPLQLVPPNSIVISVPCLTSGSTWGIGVFAIATVSGQITIATLPADTVYVNFDGATFMAA
jgi:hypothetical protein